MVDLWLIVSLGLVLPVGVRFGGFVMEFDVASVGMVVV